MRLNKWQYAWIRRLKSGKTKKLTGFLQQKGSTARCCLGEGAVICGEPPSKKGYVPDLCKFNYPLTTKRLKLKPILVYKISKKWRYKLGLSNEPYISLAELNDGNGPAKMLSHVEIGKFIDENREAVFLK